MRNGLSSAAVVTSREILPEFIKLEQALIDKLEVLRNNLNNELDKISKNDDINISPSARNEIRRILLDAQRTLGNTARTYSRSNVLLNFYRDVNQFVQMVDEMEEMFCQTLKQCRPRKEESEEDLLLLGVEKSDSESEKTAEELFSEFSENNKANLLADHSDMINQIQRTGELSGAIYDKSKIFDRNAQEPVFLTRFFDARRIISEAIEKIHYVIHPRQDEASTQGEARRRPRSESVDSKEERCYEFGLLSLCSKMEKQVCALLKKNNLAQEKRINILKMICSLTNRMPESPSSADSLSSCASSESSMSDSSRASSLASSGLFSRSSSPDSRDPNQSSNASAWLG